MSEVMMSKVIEDLAAPLAMFKAEAEEVRKEQGMSNNDVSLNMSGYASAYTSFLNKEGCTIKSLQSVADALNKRLVICLLDKD